MVVRAMERTGSGRARGHQGAWPIWGPGDHLEEGTFGLSSEESLGLQCEEVGHGGGHRTDSQGEESVTGALTQE